MDCAAPPEISGSSIWNISLQTDTGAHDLHRATRVATGKLCDVRPWRHGCNTILRDTGRYTQAHGRERTQGKREEERESASEAERQTAKERGRQRDSERERHKERESKNKYEKSWSLVPLKERDRGRERQ